MVEHNQSSYYNNGYKFNGKELDEATGMYYYGARYYDPRISIFISVDPLAEETMTPYQYCGNNPIMFVDPTGMNHHDYEYGDNGKISLIRKTGDNKDRLIAKNGDVIADNIDQRILKDGINIAENGLIIDGLDKKKDKDLNARVGDLMTNISIYEQKEIAWGFFGGKKDNNAFILIMGYAKNDSHTSESVRNVHGGSNFSLLISNHTHPSFWDKNIEGNYIGNSNGYPTPSESDWSSSYEAKISNYVWGRSGVSFYKSNNGVRDLRLVRDYNKEGGIKDINYVNKKLGWKKSFIMPK